MWHFFTPSFSSFFSSFWIWLREGGVRDYLGFDHVILCIHAPLQARGKRKNVSSSVCYQTQTHTEDRKGRWPLFHTLCSNKLTMDYSSLWSLWQDFFKKKIKKNSFSSELYCPVAELILFYKAVGLWRRGPTSQPPLCPQSFVLHMGATGILSMLMKLNQSWLSTWNSMEEESPIRLAYQQVYGGILLIDN